MEGGEQAGTDGHEDGADDHEGSVIAEGRHHASSKDGGNDNGEQHGQIPDTRVDSRDALDGLKPDRDVVDENEKGCSGAKGIQTARPYGSVGKNSRRDRGIFALAVLDVYKQDDENAKEHKERNDATAVPGVCSTTPLQSKEQADDGGHEDKSTDRIKVPESLHKGLVLGLVDLGAGKEEEDDNHCDGTNGQVDEEAPSPGLASVSKDTNKWNIGKELTALSVKAPPIRGPATEAIPYMPPIKPV